MRGKFAAAVSGTIATLVWVTSGVAFAEEASVKQLMGENFAATQVILTSLMTSNYSAAPDQIAIIADHADDLTQAVPDSVHDKNRDQFLAYAYILRGHARDLKSIVDQLIAEDASRTNGQQLETLDLREAAAAHYGGMVTTCVACHNHFRMKVIN